MLEHLEGLDEKSRVLNNDELADAIQSRTEELSSRSIKWLPEVHSFLLHLSDDPIRKTQIEGLRAFEQPPSPTPLTWAEILRDDPFDNTNGIWDNVDFGAGSSSDGESLPDQESGSSRSTDASFLSAEDGQNALQATGPAPDIKSLQAALETRRALKTVERRSPSDFILLPEALVVRQTLSMLQGLPSPPYSIDDDGLVEPINEVRMKNVSAESQGSLLKRFASVGTQLQSVRQFIGRRTSATIEQALQASLQTILTEMDSDFSSLATTRPGDGRHARTLTWLLRQVEAVLRSVSFLTHESTMNAIRGGVQSYRILDCLHDLVCDTQSLGDIAAFERASRIFFDCLRPYMARIRLWMESGELGSAEQGFFVQRRRNIQGPLLDWSRSLELVREDGAICAPAFLQVACQKILTAGKSAKLLRTLGFQGTETFNILGAELSFETVCDQENHDLLRPFSEVLGQALDSWIRKLHHVSSSTLLRVLSEECGVFKGIDALEFVYLSRNGHISSSVTRRVCGRIDRRKQNWNNKHAITGVYQSAFADLKCVEVARLTARFEKRNGDGHSAPSIRDLGSLKIRYALPWSVQVLVDEASQAVYGDVAVLLMQTERARQLLVQTSTLRNGLTASARGPVSILELQLQVRLTAFINAWQTYLSLLVLPRASARLRDAIHQADDIDDMVRRFKHAIHRLACDTLLSESQAPAHQALLCVLDLFNAFADACSRNNERHIGEHRPLREAEKDSSSEDDDSPSLKDGELTKPGAGVKDLRALLHRYHSDVSAFVAHAQQAGEEQCEPSLSRLADDFNTSTFKKSLF